jgi:hypothetical protein
LPSVECTTPATATRTFGRRPDEGGRGFQLVNEIAQRWGFLRERAGTCVWFELAPQD